MTVEITSQAEAQYHKLPKHIKIRMLKIAQRLECWPQVSGCKALAGAMKGYHRVRSGDYRLIFQIKGRVVVVVKMGHRKDVYE